MFQPFYHQLLRKYHIAFGSLFSQITLLRLDESGTEKQRFVVPIEYSPRESWLTRLRKDPNIEQKAAQVMPRLAYEMVGLRYDTARQLNRLSTKFVAPVGDAGNYRFFTGIPYLLTFNLMAVTRSVDDANQILEQVVPYFNPDRSLLLNVLPSVGIADRMRVVIDGTPQWMDSYEGDSFAKTREIILTFVFTVQATFYGPISNAPANLIRKVIVDMYDIPYDKTMGPATYIWTDAQSRLLLDTGTDETGFLLDESSALDYREMQKLVNMIIEPDPLDAQPPKPVDSTTTITEFV